MHCNNTCDELNLIQLIEIPTWKNIVNNVLKSSIFHYVYVTSPEYVTNIKLYKPIFGDHNLITFEIIAKIPQIHIIMPSNWSQYTKENLKNPHAQDPLDIETDTVQQT